MDVKIGTSILLSFRPTELSEGAEKSSAMDPRSRDQLERRTITEDLDFGFAYARNYKGEKVVGSFLIRLRLPPE